MKLYILSDRQRTLTKIVCILFFHIKKFLEIVQHYKIMKNHNNPENNESFLKHSVSEII